MTGDQEVVGNPPTCAPPSVCGDPDASGFAGIVVDPDAGTLCYVVQIENIDLATVSGAHIHEGAEGVAGPIQVTLANPDPTTGISDACADPGDYNPSELADAAAIQAFLEDLAANPSNYYVNVHNEAYPAGAVRGQLEVAFIGQVMVMKHLCDASIQTSADFAAVEAREQTNPTTPDSAFGSTAETVLACPTIVLPGEPQTIGAVAGGEHAFEFMLEDTSGTQTLSTDASFSGEAALCETDVAYDADRDGILEADVCLDISHHIFDALEGAVEVTETSPPAGTRFGALRFTPGSGDDATLLSANAGVIQLDTTADDDTSVMLHVYDFVNAAAASPTPVASRIPNTRTSSSPSADLPLVAIAAGIFVAAAASAVAVQTRRRLAMQRETPRRGR
ncbi:MAG: CHRD domain-containing protein [Chloroflexota bacterium]|nr:CHRD domain-containing protein [Chloroflexota bacterium]